MGPKLTKIVTDSAFSDYGDGMTIKAILQELYQLCEETNEARFLAVDEFVITTSALDECFI